MGWLVGRLVGQLVGRLVGQLVVQFVDQLMGRLVFGCLCSCCSEVSFSEAEGCGVWRIFAPFLLNYRFWWKVDCWNVGRLVGRLVGQLVGRLVFGCLCSCSSEVSFSTVEIFI